MELRQIQYLVAMYEEGSVTQAARRLNIVQPAISQQLSKLEAEFGQQLFYRTPKGMVPTKAGENAYRILRPILQDLDFARMELAVRKGEIKGHISIGVVASIASSVLPEVTKAFIASYPQVSIRATGGYTTELLEMLRNATLDIAIVNVPARAPNIDVVDIMNEDFAMILAPGHPLAGERSIELSALSRHPIVIPSMRHGLRAVIEDVAQQKHVRLRPQLEFDEIASIDNFVQQSEFITILPPVAVKRSLAAGKLTQVPLLPSITRKIVCATSPSRPVGRAAELFIQILRKNSVAIIHQTGPYNE